MTMRARRWLASKGWLCTPHSECRRGSAEVPPGGKMAESRSRGPGAFSANVPPGGTNPEKRSRPLERLSVIFPPGGTLAEFRRDSERGVQSISVLSQVYLDCISAPRNGQCTFTFVRGVHLPLSAIFPPGGTNPEKRSRPLASGFPSSFRRVALWRNSGGIRSEVCRATWYL